MDIWNVHGPCRWVKWADVTLSQRRHIIADPCVTKVSKLFLSVKRSSWLTTAGAVAHSGNHLTALNYETCTRAKGCSTINVIMRCDKCTPTPGLLSRLPLTSPPLWVRWSCAPWHTRHHHANPVSTAARLSTNPHCTLVGRNWTLSLCKGWLKEHCKRLGFGKTGTPIGSGLLVSTCENIVFV